MQIDVELLCQVNEDLDHIVRMATPPFQKDNPRRLANELRKLLIEGNLQRAWKLLGNSRSPVIRASKMHEISKAPNTFSVALGADLHGINAGGITLIEGNIDENALKRMAREAFDLKDYPFALNEYLNSTSIWYKNTSISRRDVIKYVANKKGGVHYDENRKDNQNEKRFELIDEVVGEGIWFGGYNEERDSEEKNTDFSKPENSTGAVSAEIISICQNLTRSDDVKKLQLQIRECVDDSYRREI